VPGGLSERLQQVQLQPPPAAAQPDAAASHGSVPPSAVPALVAEYGRVVGDDLYSSVAAAAWQPVAERLQLSLAAVQECLLYFARQQPGSGVYEAEACRLEASSTAMLAGPTSGDPFQQLEFESGAATLRLPHQPGGLDRLPRRNGGGAQESASVTVDLICS